MNSSAPISRLVRPRATSVSTCRSRGVRPKGSSSASAGAVVGRGLAVAVVLQRQPCPRDQPLELVDQPCRADPPCARQRASGRLGRGRRGARARGTPRPRRRCMAATSTGARVPSRHRPRRVHASPGSPPRRAQVVGDRRRRQAVSIGRPAAAAACARESMMPARAIASASASALAEVARPLGQVGLDRHARGRQPPEPDRVVAAELQPLQRALDRFARADGIAVAAISSARSTPATATNCGSSESTSSASASSIDVAGCRVVPAPQRELGAAQLDVDAAVAARAAGRAQVGRRRVVARRRRSPARRRRSAPTRRRAPCRRWPASPRR